jgi:exosortase/archaeosortase family protein
MTTSATLPTIRLQKKSRMIVRVVAFVVVFCVLEVAWQWTDGTALHRSLIERAVVAPAAAIARQLTPDEPVVREGDVLRGPGAQLRIVPGCDGTETLFLLSAGFAVAPLPWRRRLLAWALGVPFVYALNQARILSLYYSLRASADLFDALHGIVTPILMVVAVLAFYYAWLQPRSGTEIPQPR